MPRRNRPKRHCCKTAQPAAEERHEAIRSFDPERAVIYAEILQPKFKEYE